MTERVHPELFVVIGPNGSGKSSAIFENRVDKAITFVNPDDIARSDFSDVADFAERDFLAWKACNAQRDALLAQKVSFGFETVGSHVSKLEFMQEAQRLGYRVTLLFVATESPDINIARIRQRQLQGGHGVPDEKVRSRYTRTLELLGDYFETANTAVVWDNSIESSDSQSEKQGMRELVRKDDRGVVEVLPAAYEVSWLRKYLPTLFEDHGQAAKH